VQHVAQALLWVVGIERQVGGAGLEDPEEADRQRERPLDAEGDHRLGSDAAPREVRGEPLGPRLQLGVGEALFPLACRGIGLGGDGDGLRGAARLFGDPLAQLLALGGAEERQLRERHGARLGAGCAGRGEGSEDRREVPGEAPHGRRIEEVRGVFEGEGEAAGALDGGDGQVEARGGRRQLLEIEDDARGVRGGGGVWCGPAEVLQHEHHLEERCGARVARHA